MPRRAFDFILSSAALLFAAPIVLCAAVVVKLSSPGPVFYAACRVGRSGRLFTMYKLRTMHCRDTPGSSITGAADSRIFAAGRILRKLKIDELPQLINIIRGDMAIVGPRPEAADIVEQHYTSLYHQTLNVRPGLTSPGAIYNYTHGERMLAEADADAELVYSQCILPEKMALELQYVQSNSLFTDLKIVSQTAAVLIQIGVGRTQFPLPEAVRELRTHSEHRAVRAA